MIFPFDVIDWLFGIGQNVGGGIGNWLSDIGGKIASGLEGGFIAILKDIWDTVRPVTYILLGFWIMLAGSLWMFTGSGTFRALVSAGAMLVK